MNKLFYILLAFLGFSGVSQADIRSYKPKKTSKPISITAQSVYGGNGVLWGFDFLSEDEVLLTHRKGTLYYYNFATKKKIPQTPPQVVSKGQGGLLDLKIKKIASQKKEGTSVLETWVYVTYSEQVNGTLTTSLARALWSHPTRPLKFNRLFSAKVKSDTTRHFGSRIAFNRDQLFMSIGDRGKRELAQDLKFHNGKILRLTLSGQPYPNNPFTTTKSALSEVWSYGHRNPQGLFWDPKSQKLYSCEFGPMGGDELNIIKMGKNYGWPIITYGREYYGPSIGTTHKSGMEQPLKYWIPSISPSGMMLYHGDKHPTWKGRIFLAALGSQHLRLLTLQNQKILSEDILFKGLNERVRHVQASPQGEIYFSTDSGLIYKVSVSH